MTASWDPEATEVSDDSPTLVQPTIPVYTQRAFVPISIEAHMDAVDVAAEVAELLQTARDDLESVTFVTGTGTNQPTGIITALSGTASVVNAGTADTFGLVDLYGSTARCRPSSGSRRRGSRTARSSTPPGSSTPAAARRCGRSSRATSRRRCSVSRPSKPKRWRRPSPAPTRSSWCSATSTTTSIADRIGTTIEFIPHLFGAAGRPTGQRGWFMFARIGADSVNHRRFRMLNGQ